MVVAAMAATLYFWLYPYLHTTEQVRYRVEVAISTPQGKRSGMGVWGFRSKPTFRGTPGFDTGWIYDKYFDGEAVEIKLSDHRSVFALLGGRVPPQDARTHAYFLMGKVRTLLSEGLRKAGFGYPEPNRDRWTYAQNEAAWAKAHLGVTVQLNCNADYHRNRTGDCPALVEVLRSHNEHRITLLDPTWVGEHLGSGFSLDHIRLTVTNDPITRGIQKRLPWVMPPTREELRLGVWSSMEDEMRRVGFARAD